MGNVVTHLIAAIVGGTFAVASLLILQASSFGEREAIIVVALNLLRENATGDMVDQIIDLKQRAEELGITIGDKAGDKR